MLTHRMPAVYNHHIFCYSVAVTAETTTTTRKSHS